MFDGEWLVLTYHHGIVSAPTQLFTLSSWSLSWKLVITADQDRHILETAASERFMAAWQKLRLDLVCHAVFVLDHLCFPAGECKQTLNHKQEPH